MGISFAEFDRDVFFCIDFPVMIRGPHGIGKSQVIYQFAKKIGWDPKTEKVVLLEETKGKGKRKKVVKNDIEGVIPYNVIERRASQMTEGDTLGMPSQNPKMVCDLECTTWNPPEWFAKACTEPSLLFLDEIDRGTQEVRQSLFELADSRKIWGRKLHPGTLVFAAVNGGEHGMNYQVQEMDPAEKDRWTIFDIEPTVEDWLTWGKSEDENGNRRIMDLICQYIHQNPQQLEHKKNFEPAAVYPSRRSWDRLNQALSKGDLIARLQKKDKGAFATAMTVSTGFIGFDTAIHFVDFVRKYEFQVSVEEILDQGKLERVKDFGFNDHLALIEKMDGKGIFKNKLTDKQMKNMADYFVLLPGEVAVKLWETMISNTEEILKTDEGVQYIQKFFQMKTTKGESIKARISSILIADPEIMQRVAESNAKKEEEKAKVEEVETSEEAVEAEESV